MHSQWNHALPVIREKKGFGSEAKRFGEAEKDIPGPGTYLLLACAPTLEYGHDSISKVWTRCGDCLGWRYVDLLGLGIEGLCQEAEKSPGGRVWSSCTPILYESCPWPLPAPLIPHPHTPFPHPPRRKGTVPWCRSPSGGGRCAPSTLDPAPASTLPGQRSRRTRISTSTGRRRHLPSTRRWVAHDRGNHTVHAGERCSERIVARYIESGLNMMRRRPRRSRPLIRTRTTAQPPEPTGSPGQRGQGASSSGRGAATHASRRSRRLRTNC